MSENRYLSRIFTFIVEIYKKKRDFLEEIESEEKKENVYIDVILYNKKSSFLSGG